MHKVTLTACATVLTFTAVLAEKQPAAGKKGFPPRARQPGARVLETFDKDGDGKLSPEERTAMREEMRKNREKAFDKDGDGKLSPEERVAMQDVRKAREKAFDKDGDGKLSPEERVAMREEMMKKARERHRKGGPGAEQGRNRGRKRGAQAET